MSADLGKREMVGYPDRRPIEPGTAKTMSAAIAVIAFSSTDWIMRNFRCDLQQARTFKANAQMDFENLMNAARAAKGRF